MTNELAEAPKPKRRRAVSTAELYWVLEALLPLAKVEIECLADYVRDFPDDPDHAEDAEKVHQGEEALASTARLIARETGTIRQKQQALRRPEDGNLPKTELSCSPE